MSLIASIFHLLLAHKLDVHGFEALLHPGLIQSFTR
jgi:hypothetical protein